MRIMGYIAAALLSACALGASPVARADGSRLDELIEGVEDALDDRRRRGMSLDEAVERVQSRYGARVIRADVRESGGRRVYVLRLLSDEGYVWTVRIDAATGSMR